jgi:tRNA pseudouridine13 synthase
MPSDPVEPSAPALPRARFKASPEDFVVEEIPAYPASGAGEHVFVGIRKRELATPDAARRLARALSVSPNEVSWAGLKDRVAVATQTLSVRLPLGVDAAAALASFADPALEILSVARHGNKLKPGHLHGNRFTILLRELGDASDAVAKGLAEMARTGAPNAFGFQRFGRDQRNVERALDMLSGKMRPPRDKRQARLLFSALQSALFNEVLEARLKDGSWCTVLPGDLAKKEDTGGLFLVPLEGDELADAVLRAGEGLIAATGPLFGAKMRWPEGASKELEAAVLARSGLTDEALEQARSWGEGTRRPLRIPVEALSTERTSDGLLVRFTLPKGAYATTVLGRVVTLDERGAEAEPGPEHEGDTASE